LDQHFSNPVPRQKKGRRKIMAQHKRAARTQGTTRKKVASSSRRRTARRTGSRRRQSLMNSGMLAVRSGVSGDVNAMQDEIRSIAGDLQDRLARLNKISRKGAAHAGEGVQDFIADTLSSLTGRAVSRLTSRVQDRASDLTDEAARVGNKAIRRVTREVDKRPLLTLAIAAGVGYLAGMAMNRD
jgi:ElaB/YqjD/DUF883 family membrane-anchored ribosome-binding protein